MITISRNNEKVSSVAAAAYLNANELFRLISLLPFL